MDEHTVTLRPPVWAILLAVLLAGSFYVTGKKIEQKHQEILTISVTGEGKIFIAPDIAELNFGMQTGPQSSAKIAVSQLEKSMKAIMESVKELGIADKDIRTAQLSLSPVYDWGNGRQTLRGYEARQNLSVKVRDLDKVGDALSRAASAGANQIGGVNFTVDSPNEAKAKARKEAIEEAQAKAVRLASDLGVRLGKLRAFNEGGGGYYPPVPMMARFIGGVAMDTAEKESLPVPKGEQEIAVTVTLTYELR